MAGEPDSNGLGTIAIARTDNGEVKEFKNWKTNPDIVVMFNNSVMAPDLNIDRIADLMTELDKSMRFNVIYSRLYPMPVATDENTRKAADMALDNMIKGEIKTILANPKELEEYANGNDDIIPIVNISDVKNSDRIQYLSKFHDDIVRWFYTMYGMDINSTSKLAQQNSDEIKTMQGVSMVLPTNMFDEAQKAVELLNKKFGWNCSIEYNTPWLVDMPVDEKGEIVEDEADEDNPKDDSESTDEPEAASKESTGNDNDGDD